MRRGLCIISPLLLVAWMCQHRGVVVAATLADTAISEPDTPTSFSKFDAQSRHRLKRHRRSRKRGRLQYADTNADVDGDANAADNRSLATKKKLQRQTQSDSSEIDTLPSASSDYNINNIDLRSRDSRDQRTQQLTKSSSNSITNKNERNSGENTKLIRRYGGGHTKRNGTKGVLKKASVNGVTGGEKGSNHKTGSNHKKGSNHKQGVGLGLPQDGSPGREKGSHKAVGTKKGGSHGSGMNKGMHNGTKKEAHKGTSNKAYKGANKVVKKGMQKGKNSGTKKGTQKGLHKGNNKGPYKGMHKGKNKGTKKVGNGPSGKPGGGMGLPPGYGHGHGWTSPPAPGWDAPPEWHAPPPKKMCPCPHEPEPEWHGGWPNHHYGDADGHGDEGMHMRPYNAEFGRTPGEGNQESIDGSGDNEQGELVPMNGGWYPPPREDDWGPGWGGSSWGSAWKPSKTSSDDWDPSWGGYDYWGNSHKESWEGGWWAPPPMCECETQHPTPVPTHHPTEHPTDHPTNHPTDHPTDHPTRSPTRNPTDRPSSHPTNSPSNHPTQEDECGWHYWGGDEGRGDVVGFNQKVPEMIDQLLIDLSAGSRHTFIIANDGVAYVAGFIESFFSYQGHMGVERGMLDEGPNDFLAVPTVVIGKESVPAPKFVKVYAGAGAPGDSRDMHSLLIDENNNVYTTGHNDNGQLCHGDFESKDVFQQVALPFKCGGAVAAAVGLDFTLILMADGSVYGCGSNENGEIGLGPSVRLAQTPTQIQGLSNIKDVSAGLNFGLYLERESGKVLGSGSNLFSQLCESTSGDPVDIPKELVVENVAQIMAGRESSYFLYPNGSVESCGRNDEGQLADGTFVDSNVPVRVDTPKNTKILHLGSGPSSQSAFFVADEGLVYAAGQNYRFQLGIGMIGSGVFPVVVDFDVPYMFEINKISSSGTHTVAISCRIYTKTPTATPTEFPTENPTDMPTELPTENPTELPTEMPTSFPTIAPTSAPSFIPTVIPTMSPSDPPTAEPTQFPTVTPTTSPTYLDPPTMFPTIEPTQIPTSIPTDSPTYVEPPTFFPTSNPTGIPTGIPTNSPTFIELNWYFWGAEEGRGNTLGDDITVPELVEGEVIDVSAGSRHTFLITGDGLSYAAGFVESGFSYRGHLGLGPVQDCSGDKDKLCEYENDPLPVMKVVDTDGKRVDAPPFKRVYAGVGVPADSGEMHSVQIGVNGKVYTTGNNNKGQLCLGDLENRDYFHEVPRISNVVAAAVGLEFTLILLENGDVYGCGTNEVGQIGQGQDTVISQKPMQIEKLSNIDEISTGLSFAIFLDKDKSRVWGTGSNLYWQQCAGTSGIPFQSVREINIDKGGDITHIETSRESSYFLFDDGKARSCGRNDEGQLGNGDFINSESQKKPIVDVDVEEDIIRIGSGPSSQSVFFITAEDVWAAGLNDRHQLGIDEIGSRDMPVQVEFQCEVSINYVSSSGTHTVADGFYIDDCNL